MCKRDVLTSGSVGDIFQWTEFLNEWGLFESVGTVGIGFVIAWESNQSELLSEDGSVNGNPFLCLCLVPLDTPDVGCNNQTDESKDVEFRVKLVNGVTLPDGIPGSAWNCGERSRLSSGCRGSFGDDGGDSWEDGGDRGGSGGFVVNEIWNKGWIRIRFVTGNALP